MAARLCYQWQQLSQPKGENSGTVDYVKNLQVRLQQVHQLARTNLKKTVNYRKKHYNIKRSKSVLASGQAEWLYEPSKRPGVCVKLTPKWKGPALVLQKLDDLIYLVNFCLFNLVLYVPSTIFQLYRDGSSWVEPVPS